MQLHFLFTGSTILAAQTSNAGGEKESPQLRCQIKRFQSYFLCQKPSLRSHAGILRNPVDLLFFNFLSSLAKKDSLTLESLKLFEDRFAGDLGADNTEVIHCLNFAIAVEKYLAKPLWIHW